MPSVTQLRRSATADFAEVRGAPRPLLPSVGRPGPSGPATVLAVRPAVTSPAEDAPVILPGKSPAVGGAAGQADAAIGSAPGSAAEAAGDAAASQRIAGIARSVAQGALEVLTGSRPLQQMARWLDPENYERLQLRANLVRCIGSAPAAGRAAPPVIANRHIVVRSARVCPVTPGVYEASVVAFDQKRVRAVALRIEQRRGTWRVTALEIG